MDQKYKKLEDAISKLEEKFDYYKNVQRRSNLRLQGFLEAVEGTDAISFLQEWIPKILDLLPPVYPLEIGRAHRTLRRRLPGQVAPRAFVIISTVPGHCSHPLCCQSKGRAQVRRCQNYDLSGSFSHTTQEDGFLPTEETSVSGWLGIRPALPSDFVDRNQEW